MSTHPSSTRSGRERAFTVLALMLPVLFFVLLEGGLRLAGYGEDYPLFLPVEGSEEYLHPNSDVAKRYFSRQDLLPGIPFDAFRRRKEPSSIRVFVQGGSSAAGYPFYFGGFSDMLEQRLLQTFPGRNVEVVNTSMAAVNSYTLLDLADEIIAQRPNAVLVYAGHNEYYGALGAASTESIGRWRSTVLLFLRLRKWRTLQLVREIVTWAAGLIGGREKGEAPGETLMARMVGEQSVPFRSNTFDDGVSQFEGNIRDLVAKYRKAGIPVFLGTVISNIRDHAPFVSGHVDGTDVDQWDDEFASAVREAAAGDTAGALTALDRLLSGDDLSADAWFAKAKLLDGLGRSGEARTAYYAAKDRDELRFRAPEAINDAIRRIAEQPGVTLVDVQAGFEEASPTGIPGQNLMTEHLHPNIDGFFAMADAFYDALVHHQSLAAWAQPVPKEEARGQMLMTEIDSLVGTYRVNVLTNSWPFKPVGHVAREPDFHPETLPESLAVEVFRNKMSRVEALDELRAYYLSRLDATSALKVTLSMIQHYPFLIKPYLAAADIYVAQGALDAALTYYLAANERSENARSCEMIGGILLRQGKSAESIPYLERSLELAPDNRQSLYNLAGAYALTMKYRKARETVERLLELQPDHADARRLLESLPE